MKRTSIIVTLLLVFFALAAQAQNALRMNSNQRLDKGQKIEVAGKGYLIMQTDGNLVAYTSANVPKWATMTNGKTVTHAIMQTDGNLVVYNNSTPHWASHSWNVGANGGYFEIDLTTWRVAIFKSNGTVAKELQAGTAPPPPPPPAVISATSLRLNAGQRLEKGQKMEVAGKGYLTLQADGNFAAYNATNQLKWSANTTGYGCTHVIMNSDGNLVVHTGLATMWTSNTAGTFGSDGGYFLVDVNTWQVGVFRSNGALVKEIQAAATPTINTAQTVNMKFVNRGTKAVEIWTTTAQGLPGTKVTDLGNKGQVSIPVKYGDQFLVKTPYIATANAGAGVGSDLFSYHPKIVISDLNAPAVEIHGNLPCNEFRSTGGLTYKVMDYEYNCQGIDLTQLNPRDLVSTINKPMLFEKINPTSDVDYHYTGDKIMKYGFTYSAKNLSKGDNSVRMSYGYSSFSKDFNINVAGSAPVGAAEVGASAGFNMTESTEKSNESVYTYTREQKSVFEVKVDPKQAQLNHGFMQAVHAINDIHGARVLVEQYGTHYSKSIIYGGDRSLYMVSTKEEYSSIKGFGIDLKAEVSVAKSKQSNTITQTLDANKQVTGSEITYGSKSSPVGSGSIGFGYNENSVAKSKLENKTMRYRLIGGSGSFDAWTVAENTAAPVFVDVAKISDLIDPLVFKDGTDPVVLAQKKALVLQAILEKLGGMDQLGPALPSPRAYVIEIPNWHVDDAVPDDANKRMGCQINIHLSNNGTSPSKYEPIDKTIHQHGWTNDYFIHNKTHTIDKKFTFVHYPEPNGSFDNLYFRINGSFSEEDDLDHNDHFNGNTGFINANTLTPGNKVTNLVKCWGDRQETGIHIHYNLLRELDSFAPILAGI